MLLTLVFTQQINHNARCTLRNFDSEGIDKQLNTYVQLHLHDTVLNEPEVNHNQPAIISYEMKPLNMRLSNLFPEDVLAVVRFCNSALKDFFVNVIPSFAAMVIILSFLQLCFIGFSKRTL
jgi:hypothetical protein